MITVEQLAQLKELCHGHGGFFSWASLEDKVWDNESILYHIHKWLREKHNIQIVIEPARFKKHYAGFVYKDFFLERKVMNDKTWEFPCYEDALYASILKAFELI